MMKKNHNNRGKGCLGTRGFSLIELLIVIAILGILSATVGVYINTADTKLKSFAFSLGSRFKLAKFEAIKRGRDVYLDFDIAVLGSPGNGYSIWVDNNNNGAYNAFVDVAHGAIPANGICDADEGDCLIGDPVVFNPGGGPGPAIYDSQHSGGPAAGPAGRAFAGGVTAEKNRFRFQSSGDCSAGSAYIYFSRGANSAVAAGPWAIIVSNVGRIRLDEWKAGKGWKVDK